MVDSPDGGFFIGGYRGDSALILKVDPLGSVLWARTFKSGSVYSDGIWQLAISPDGHLIGCGASLGGTPYIARDIFYFKFDLDGNPIWIRVSADDRPLRSFALLPKSASEYVLVNVIYDMGSATFPDPITHGVSAADGSFSWTSPRYDYVANNSYIDDMCAAVMGDGENWYGTGRIFLNGSTPSGMRPFISKFDGTGNHIWTRFHISSASDDARVYGSDIVYGNDSLTVSYFGDIDQYSNIYRVGLIHTDTAGNVAWVRDYDLVDFGTEYSFKLLRMPYGYAITGYGTGATNDLFAIGLSAQGHVLWSKGYGTTVEDEDLRNFFNKNAVASGSDILITGERTSGGDNDILLYRVDATGSISCGGSYDLTVIETDGPTFSAPLDPQPIPDGITYEPVDATAWSPINNDCLTTGGFLGNDTAACSAVLFDASGSGASTYLWQDGSTDATFTANGPGTYWVLASIDCCISSDTVIVSSTAAPTASFDPQSDPCLFEVTFTNTSINADQFDWQFGDGSSSSLEQPTNTYDSTGTYTVVLIASNGCGADTASQDVTITAQASLTLSGPDSLCANEEALYAVLLDGANILSSQWSTGEMDTDSVLFSTASSVEVSVNITGDNGCTYSSAIELLITPPPSADFTLATEDCGNQVQFTDASTGALSWSWDFDNGSGSSSPSPLAEYQLPGTFVVVLVVSNDCGSDTVSQELVLGPTGNVSINGPSVLCPDSIGSFTVTLNGADITSVDWSNGSDDATTQFSTPDDANFSVSVYGDDGCMYADTIAISVLSAPQAGFTTAVDPCDSVVQFIDASLNGLAWQWDLGNGQSSSLADPEATYPSPGMYTATLIVSGECGTDTASQNIGIGALGTLHLQGPATICDNEEVAYSVTLVGGSVSHVQWSTGDTTSSILLQVSGDQLLTATVVGDDGCVYEAEVDVQVIGLDGAAAAYVPNVFSPNGDGLNETFAPVLSDPDSFRELLIFNRWGQEIYATSSIAQPWNGRVDGDPVPDGTYVYIVRWKDRCTGVKKEEHGHVTLLR